MPTKPRGGTHDAVAPRVTSITRATGALQRILVLLLMQALARQQDGAVERVGETAVAAADLHGDDDEFGEGLELAREGGVGVRVAEAEADGAVRGYDFEEDGEEREGVLVCVFEAPALDDGDEEEAEEDVPQVE